MRLFTFSIDINKILFDNPSSIFHVLTESEKELLRSRMVIHKYRKGEYIIRTGDTPAGLFYLISGMAKICRLGAGGREYIFRMAQSNGLIGYLALFANQIYGASAKAIEDSVAVMIDRETLYSLLHTNNELSILFIKSLSTELSFSYFRAMTLSQKQMAARLAESLIFLRDTYGLEDDGVTLNVRLSREDLANLSNMSTSNAIRTLSSFAAEKLIAIERKNIKLLNIAGLEEISGEGSSSLKFFRQQEIRIDDI